MFLYNKSDVAKEDELLAIINKAYYQMGCTHFYLDNLMMMKLENTGDDIYKKQAGFMNSLKSYNEVQKYHIKLFKIKNIFLSLLDASYNVVRFMNHNLILKIP